MKKLSSHITLLIVSVVGALALCALYAYLLASLIKFEERQQNFAGEIRDSNMVIAEETVNKAALAGYFLKEGEQALFVSGLESSCFTRSLICDTRALMETPDASGGPAKVLGMTLFTQGSFTDISGLLKELETSPYPIIIHKTSLSSKESEAGTSGWEGVIELSVPVLITT